MQGSCILEKVVIFGQKRLYSDKVVVFVQKWLCSGKVVVFMQGGCKLAQNIVFG